MTNVGEYRDHPKRQRRKDQPAEYHKPAEKGPREVSPPPGLMLSAMLVQRVRVKLADGVHWMSGYDALASVLRERSAAGDARASMLLSSLTRYAALSDQGNLMPTHAAPQTEAEKALANAFVRRTIDGLTADRAAKAGRRAASAARPARRKERSHAAD